jgi:hypothetical protein
MQGKEEKGKRILIIAGILLMRAIRGTCIRASSVCGVENCTCGFYNSCMILPPHPFYISISFERCWYPY